MKHKNKKHGFIGFIISIIGLLVGALLLCFDACDFLLPLNITLMSISGVVFIALGTYLFWNLA